MSAAQNGPQEAAESQQELCWSPHFDAPELACSYPVDHGPVPVPESAGGGTADHGNESEGAWWSTRAIEEPVETAMTGVIPAADDPLWASGYADESLVLLNEAAKGIADGLHDRYSAAVSGLGLQREAGWQG